MCIDTTEHEKIEAMEIDFINDVKNLLEEHGTIYTMFRDIRNSDNKFIEYWKIHQHMLKFDEMKNAIIREMLDTPLVVFLNYRTNIRYNLLGEYVIELDSSVCDLDFVYYYDKDTNKTICGLYSQYIDYEWSGSIEGIINDTALNVLIMLSKDEAFRNKFDNVPPKFTIIDNKKYTLDSEPEEEDNLDTDFILYIRYFCDIYGTDEFARKFPCEYSEYVTFKEFMEYLHTQECNCS